jgi:hypothetical protein
MPPPDYQQNTAPQQLTEFPAFRYDDNGHPIPPQLDVRPGMAGHDGINYTPLQPQRPMGPTSPINQRYQPSGGKGGTRQPPPQMSSTINANQMNNPQGPESGSFAPGNMYHNAIQQVQQRVNQPSGGKGGNYNAPTTMPSRQAASPWGGMADQVSRQMGPGAGKGGTGQEPPARGGYGGFDRGGYR